MKTGRARVRWAVSLAVALVAAGSAAAADLAWPGGADVEIDNLLTKKYETSGVVWDPVSGKYYAVSEGIVTQLTKDGKVAAHWSVGPNDAPFAGSRPDFEGVTVTGKSPMVYVARESPPTIYEFDPAAGAFTKRNWPLAGMQTTDSSGMEGLTFVPNGYHPYPAGSGGGLFYASSQKNGTLYVFDAFAKPEGGTVDSIASFTPDSTEHDVADLYFSTGTRTLYVLYGNARKIIQVAGDTLENGLTYKTPTIKGGDKDDNKGNKGFEGITLVGTCPGSGATATIALGNDVFGTLYSYTAYPQHCAVTLANSGDATVDQKAEEVNHGADKTLSADLSPDNEGKPIENLEILIQFLDAPAKVAAAKLQLYVTDGTDKSPKLCYVATPWSESTVTWKTAPACAEAASGGGVSAPKDQWITYDVTRLVNAGHLSFRLVPSSTGGMVANSKEAPDHRPVLIVTPLN